MNDYIVSQQSTDLKRERYVRTVAIIVATENVTLNSSPSQI